MDFAAAFILFIASMIFFIAKGLSMVWALLIGLAAFMAVGVHRGFSIRSLAKMGAESTKDSLVVIQVMCIIGFITAAWRISGTVAVFVYYGMKIITPSLFLVIAFLLSCVLSYALGTSFGVAGTVGVIFMTLARCGGVNPVITAGVLMSGVFFGDRNSPVSSSANLVAGVTKTDIYSNVKVMAKTGMLPLIISIVVYTVLSVQNPIQHIEKSLFTAFETDYVLSPVVFLPAVAMVVLPLLKVSVMTSMYISIGISMVVTVFVQGTSLSEFIKACIFGYKAAGGVFDTLVVGGTKLQGLLDGGGLISMIEIVIILIISCAYSGVFSGTKMLEELQNMLYKMTTKVGRFMVMIFLSIVTSAIFCNQTIATLMCCDLLERPYEDGGGNREELAIDMENSVILIACIIPWCIGCSVPLSFFGAGYSSMIYAVFMYLTPICYIFTKKRWYNDRVDRPLQMSQHLL